MDSIAVVGAGHNGLVAACYLAKAGFQVTVFERRRVFGGLACSEEIFPGYRVSALANRSGMLRRNIMHDLNLEKHGLQIFRPDFASHIISNGDAFSFHRGTQGAGHTFRVAGLSQAQVQEWYDFWQEIEAAGAILSVGIAALGYSQARFKEELRAAGMKALADALFVESLFEYSRTRVSHPSLLSALLTMSGSHPFGPSSLFEVIYYCTAESFGEAAAWGYVRGGMGSLIDALLAEARRLGVRLLANTEIFTVAGGKEAKIVLASGDEHSFDRAVLATDPVTAYKHLLREQHQALPAALLASLQSNEATSTYGILHLKLRELPRFPALSEIGRQGSQTFSGALDFSLLPNELLARFEAAQQGELLILPNLSCNVFSAIDPSLTAGKGDLMSVLIQSCDTRLKGQEARQALYTECLSFLSRWSPGLQAIVDDYRLILPEDLEHIYGVRSGCCLHLRNSSAHALDARPFPEAPGYRTPLESVYLTGAGTYPGGCVSGAPGYFCAQQVLDDYRGKT